MRARTIAASMTGLQAAIAATGADIGADAQTAPIEFQLVGLHRNVIAP